MDALAEPAFYRANQTRAKTVNAANRTVQVLITTETPVLEYDYNRDEYVHRVLLTSGAILPANNQIPLLDCHNRESIHDVLGSARSLTKEADGVAGTLHFSSIATQQWGLVTEGHTTDVSAGFRVLTETYIPAGETRTIDGRSFTGPLNVATSWQLFECSLVPIGADQEAKLRSLYSGLRAAGISNFEGEKIMTNRARPWMDKVRQAKELIENAVEECAQSCEGQELVNEVGLIAAAVQTHAEVIDAVSEGEDTSELEGDLENILTMQESLS